MAEGVHLALVVALAPATNSKLGLALGNSELRPHRRSFLCPLGLTQ